MRKGNREGSLNLFREAVDVDPGNAGLISLVAWYLAEAGVELEWAQELAEKAALLSPPTPHILDTLGWIHFRMGRFKEAARRFREALRYSESAGERRNLYTFHLALTLLRQGMEEEGITLLVRLTRRQGRARPFLYEGARLWKMLDEKTRDALKKLYPGEDGDG
jgi:tetratricopeptide (TPR) repeat protein